MHVVEVTGRNSQCDRRKRIASDGTTSLARARTQHTLRRSVATWDRSDSRSRLLDWRMLCIGRQRATRRTGRIRKSLPTYAHPPAQHTEARHVAGIEDRVNLAATGATARKRLNRLGTEAFAELARTRDSRPVK